MEEEEILPGTKLSRFLGRITRSDKIIFKFFFLMLGILFTIIIIYELLSWRSYASVVVSLLNGSMLVYLITGILTMYYTRSNIISTKKILIWFIIIALSIALIITIVLYFLLEFTQIVDEYIQPSELDMSMVYFIAWIFIYLFSIIFITLILLFVISFGANGILAVVERGIGPETMLFISRISKKISKSMKKKNSRAYWRYQSLRWRFNIPKNLNTKSLSISQVKPRHHFPWKEFKFAILWQTIFGFVIAINISLNPLLLNELSLEELSATSSFIISFILILILPFIIYNRMNATITRTKKPFTLEAGLRNRTFQIIAIAGTLIFLIRFILQDYDEEIIIYSFFIFYVIYFIISLILTFIYLNYFEDTLASDIAKRYVEIKDE